jgi:signal transduction protein with GAF and PtsI domain
MDFDFFRRSSVELCTAILQPNARASAILQQYLARIDDDRLKRTLAAAIDASEPAVSAVGRVVGRGNDLWKGLASRGSR